MLNDKKLITFLQQFHRIVFSYYKWYFKNGVFCHSLILFFCALIFFGCNDPKHVTMVRVDHIKSITASSINPSFPPYLLLDGGPSAENAWHSVVRPVFPQWIEVEYPEPVILDGIAIQSQYDSPEHKTNNLLRAPKEINILGLDEQGSSKTALIAAFECHYSKSGDWYRADFPASSDYYRKFRILIKSNLGDPDFITVQELNLFSHE